MPRLISNLKRSIVNEFSENSLPKLMFYFIIFVGILANIIYALYPPNFFYPDAIYQTLEVAHKLVYGYGIISWEWKVGYYKIGNIGYGPIRSMITPLIFASFFIFGNIFNLNYWNVVLPLIRVSLAINFIIGLYFASKILKELSPDKFSQADKIFFVLILFYHDTFLFGSKTLTNTFDISFVFIALYIWIKANKSNEVNNNSITSEKQSTMLLKFKKQFFADNSLKSKFYDLIGGFLVGIAIWIRPDSAFLMGFFVLLTIDKIQLKKTINFAIGFIFSAFLDGILDFIFYGKFFETFINYVSFNLAHQSEFGTEPFGWYFMNVIFIQFSLLYLFILTIIVLSLMTITVSMHFFTKKSFPNVTKEYFFIVKLFLWVFLDLLLWETQPHKEYRFLILWEVSFFLLASYSVYLSAKYIKKFFERVVLEKNSLHLFKTLKKYNANNKYVFLILIIFFLTIPYFRADVVESTKIPWNYNSGLLEASIWIAQQNVTGLGIIAPIYDNGGYTYLDKNVTIYSIYDPFDINIVVPFPNIPDLTTTSFAPSVLANHGLINYLIVPISQYSEFAYLNESIYASGFKLVKVIYGTCDVFYI